MTGVAIEPFEFRPGVPFVAEALPRPRCACSWCRAQRRRCRCALCVVGAHWIVTHCGRCGKPNEPYSWDNVCDDCAQDVGPRDCHEVMEVGR